MAVRGVVSVLAEPNRAQILFARRHVDMTVRTSGTFRYAVGKSLR